MEREKAKSRRKQRPTGTCALCKEVGELVDSHVFSDFTFKRMRDQINRILVISTDPSTKDRKVQSGPSEYLLCGSCDNVLLSGFENCAAPFLADVKMKLDRKQPGYVLEMTGLDYRRLKLFFVSLLWRSSVSRLELFSKTELGPYEEKARQMLLANDPGDVEEFGIACIGATLHGKSLNWMCPPSRLRNRKGTHYFAVLDGLVCFWTLKSGTAGEGFTPWLLQPNGGWKIPVVDSHDLHFVADIIRDQGAARFARAQAGRMKDKPGSKR